MFHLDRYTVLDLETPNRRGDSLCQIAWLQVEEGRVVEERVSLVDPQAPFEEFCIAVHGLTPQDVAGQPTLAQLWPSLESLFRGQIVVGHNVTFDLAVLIRSLALLGIALGPIPYLCTYRLAKRLLPHWPRSKDDPQGGYGLKALCKKYGIAMRRHHDALSDVWACQELLQALLKEGELVRDDLHQMRSPQGKGGEGLPPLYALGDPQASYCLSGKFAWGKKGRVADLIRATGGVVRPQVSSEIDYLVCGQSAAGRAPSAKVKRAQALAAAGYPWQIISEGELLEVLAPLHS